MAQFQPQTLPLLPLRRGVILPGTVTSIPVGRERSQAMVQDLEPGNRIVLAVQFDAGVEDPAIADLHPVGVLARDHVHGIPPIGGR